LSQPPDIPARHDGLLRHLAVAAVLAVVFYCAGFSWIEHRRVAQGPWEIAFISDGAGRPSLRISQPALRISERLSFPDDRVARANLAELVKFREATTNLPFGEMLLQDPLYLPGTVTLRLFGHRIQVLPRTLVVDQQEHAWKAGEEIVVRGAGNKGQ
jgi:hypothetical protein